MLKHHQKQIAKINISKLIIPNKLNEYQGGFRYE